MTNNGNCLHTHSSGTHNQKQWPCCTVNEMDVAAPHLLNSTDKAFKGELLHQTPQNCTLLKSK